MYVCPYIKSGEGGGNIKDHALKLGNERQPTVEILLFCSLKCLFMYLFKLKVGIYLLAYRLEVYRHSEKYCASSIYLLAKNLVYRLVGVPASGENRVVSYLGSVLTNQ